MKLLPTWLSRRLEDPKASHLEGATGTPVVKLEAPKPQRAPDSQISAKLPGASQWQTFIDQLLHEAQDSIASGQSVQDVQRDFSDRMRSAFVDMLAGAMHEKVQGDWVVMAVGSWAMDDILSGGSDFDILLGARSPEAQAPLSELSTQMKGNRKDSSYAFLPEVVKSVSGKNWSHDLKNELAWPPRWKRRLIVGSAGAMRTTSAQMQQIAKEKKERSGEMSPGERKWHLDGARWLLKRVERHQSGGQPHLTEDVNLKTMSAFFYDLVFPLAYEAGYSGQSPWDALSHLESSGVVSAQEKDSIGKIWELCFCVRLERSLEANAHLNATLHPGDEPRASEVAGSLSELRPLLARCIKAAE